MAPHSTTSHPPSHRLVLGLVAVLAVTVAAPLLAGPGQVEITPQIAFRSEGEIDSDIDLDVVDFDDRFDVEEGEAVGLLVGIPLAPAQVPGLRLELFANRQETEISASPGLFEPRNPGVDFEILYLQTGLAYEWVLGRARPFVAGSVGAARLEIDVPGSEAETRFAGTLGGGVKVALAEHLALRIEARGYGVYLGDDDGRDRDDCRDDRRRRCYDEFDEDGSLTQGEISLGLAFEF